MSLPPPTLVLTDIWPCCDFYQRTVNQVVEMVIPYKFNPSLLRHCTNDRTEDPKTWTWFFFWSPSSGTHIKTFYESWPHALHTWKEEGFELKVMTLCDASWPKSVKNLKYDWSKGRTVSVRPCVRLYHEYQVYKEQHIKKKWIWAN